MSRNSIVRPIDCQPATVFASSILFLRNNLRLPIQRIARAFGFSNTNVSTILSRGARMIGDPRKGRPGLSRRSSY
jgi:hypothetical protein